MTVPLTLTDLDWVSHLASATAVHLVSFDDPVTSRDGLYLMIDVYISNVVSPCIICIEEYYGLDEGKGLSFSPPLLPSPLLCICSVPVARNGVHL